MRRREVGAAATAPALAPPVLLPLCLPCGAGSSARPRCTARSAVRCELAATSASSAAPAAAPGSVAGPRWAQWTVVIPPQRRGCYIITHKIMHAIRSDLFEFKCGLAHLFLHHTSASLTLNENYDPDVQTDTETFLSRIFPEGPSAPWRHTIEGSDDMPAHIKSSMFGCALTIPITDGRLNMGTWQASAFLILWSSRTPEPKSYYDNNVHIRVTFGMILFYQIRVYGSVNIMITLLRARL